MYKTLRIIFCILTVALAAAAIFIFIFAGTLWGILAVTVAFVFGALMVTFKSLQEKEELDKNPPPPRGDFITGKVERKDDDNSDNAEKKDNGN